MTDQLVSTSRAAEAVGMSPRSLARWAREGAVIPTGHTPGGHLRWNVADLQQQPDAVRIQGDLTAGRR